MTLATKEGGVTKLERGGESLIGVGGEAATTMRTRTGSMVSAVVAADSLIGVSGEVATVTRTGSATVTTEVPNPTLMLPKTLTESRCEGLRPKRGLRVSETCHLHRSCLR